MKTCKICSTVSAEVATYSDYKNDTTINLCFRCLAEIHYCDLCSKLVPKTVALSGKNVCSECVESKNLVVCKFCNTLQDKALDYKGACDHCSPQLIACIKCGDWHFEADLCKVQGQPDKPLCKSCINKTKYLFCNYCQEWVPLAKDFNKSLNCCEICRTNIKECVICHNNIIVSNTSTGQAHKVADGPVYVCDNCVSGDCCVTCGTGSGKGSLNIKLRVSEGEGSDRRLSLCHTCWSTNNYGVIKRYGYKPRGKFKKLDTAEYPNLFLGIENEVEFSSKYSPEERVRILFDFKEEHWYIKRDGSLSNGFEVVTHPMNFEYIKSDFPIDKLFPADFDNIKAKSCGMHIHITKDAFTNAHLFKFMQFFLNEPEFCEQIAERSANSYCSKLGKSEAVQKAVRKSGGERNQVNLNNDRTVEVRIFAGAINPKQYFKNVEFIYALFCFTKKYSIINLNKTNFTEFIEKDRNKYANLLDFLAL